MIIKLAKFSKGQVAGIHQVLRGEEEQENYHMSNAAKGALWGTAAFPLVGSAIGYHLGKKSDEKRRYRIDRLREALKHQDSDMVRDVVHQDRGEFDRALKGFVLGGIPGAIAGHISQRKKDHRNGILRNVINESI